MFSESLRNSTMAVPAELGPTASPWSGGVTSPAAPAVGEFAAALIAEVMPSKPCSPVTLPLVNPVRAPAVAGWAAALGLRAAGGSPSGVTRAWADALEAARLLASALPSADRSTVPTRCRATGLPAVLTVDEVLTVVFAMAAAAGTMAAASTAAPASYPSRRDLRCLRTGSCYGSTTNMLLRQK